MNQFDLEYVKTILMEILQIDSPSGFTSKALEKLSVYAKDLGFNFEKTNKGTGIITIDGEGQACIGLCAHVDTLGLMVRSIKEDGTLKFTKIGSPTLATLDGEYCRIYTREGKVYTGTILSDFPAAHVYPEASSEKRLEENMHVQIDEKIRCKEDVFRLGIQAGDYICIDTKTELTENGFIKSRFLDDKLSVAILFGVLKFMSDYKIKPRCKTKILISSYEEVGHGMAYIPDDIKELVAVDMGCIGLDLSCSEFDVSICAKDSSGPYHYELTSQLMAIAKERKLQYAVDIYPSYSSDVSAALRAGNDIKGALIGPGVKASHGMERSHMEAVENTLKLIGGYLGIN